MNTSKKLLLETASRDKEFVFYFYHNGRKYGIKFEDGAEIISEPVRPNYLRKFKAAAERLETNNGDIEKFEIAGLIGNIKTDKNGVKAEFIIPGFLNIIVPFHLIEPNPKEIAGNISLRVRCIMKPVTIVDKK